MTLSNIEIIQLLSDGYTVAEIAKEKNVNRRTVESRILTLREQCVCKTVTQLVIKYFRLKLIE